MKTIKILDKIFQILTPAVYSIVGVLLLIYACVEKEFEHQLVGVALIVSGCAGCLNFVGSHKYKRPHAHDLLEGIMGLSLGIVFLFSNMSMENICICWGIYEIVKGAFEFEENFIEIQKKNKIAIIDLLLAIIGVIFGILLCVHLKEGLKDHLIVSGAVFLISAGLQVTELILEAKKESKTE